MNGTYRQELDAWRRTTPQPIGRRPVFRCPWTMCHHLESTQGGLHDHIDRIHHGNVPVLTDA